MSRRRKRTPDRQRQQAAERAKSGPVTVRFVDPSTLRKGRSTPLRALPESAPAARSREPFEELPGLLRALKKEAYKEPQDRAAVAGIERRIDRLLLQNAERPRRAEA